jgi:hypothetical protein
MFWVLTRQNWNPQISNSDSNLYTYLPSLYEHFTLFKYAVEDLKTMISLKVFMVVRWELFLLKKSWMGDAVTMERWNDLYIFHFLDHMNDNTYSPFQGTTKYKIAPKIIKTTN